MDQLRILKSGLLHQQQENFNQKLRSKRILSGSVVSSDGGLPFETNHYVSKGYLTYRCKNRSRGNGLHSTDSGCSVGEGCSSSPESEFEESSVKVFYQKPKTQVLRCAKCCRQKPEKTDASTQSEEILQETSMSFEPVNVRALPSSSGKMVECRVVRDRSTIISSIYPTYYMYQERKGQPHVLLLVARKRKKCSTSRYVISTRTDNLKRRSTSVVGELVSNLVGTRFRLTSYTWEREDKASKSESCSIFYEPDILGTQGPRRIKVLVPRNRDLPKQKGLFAKGRHQSTGPGNILQLVNKEPEWEVETQSHVLYFHGRVTKSSVKNFQLVHPQMDSVVLQFGKIDANEFTLDYQSPLDAVHAFAIALSSFDHKIGCE
ncbi:Hypothetical protein NTJ_02115 [Nesidiocoris tenuis]|uniref:Tubby C-terminal domain-containing protein n=1 Tax=Nesidiocoris tenuis TaxID=355587 RepID=A0ABN7AAG9_9HEMI|nr:Hypothetical protein NTJ_02115 [Nesidiocoris tenuis]